VCSVSLRSVSSKVFAACLSEVSAAVCAPRVRAKCQKRKVGATGEGWCGGGRSEQITNPKTLPGAVFVLKGDC
jgi:hypothetical protein